MLNGNQAGRYDGSARLSSRARIETTVGKRPTGPAAEGSARLSSRARIETTAAPAGDCSAGRVAPGSVAGRGLKRDGLCGQGWVAIWRSARLSSRARIETIRPYWSSGKFRL